MERPELMASCYGGVSLTTVIVASIIHPSLCQHSGGTKVATLCPQHIARGPPGATHLPPLAARRSPHVARRQPPAALRTLPTARRQPYTSRRPPPDLVPAARISRQHATSSIAGRYTQHAASHPDRAPRRTSPAAHRLLHATRRPI
jgi:hypothetical protein